MTPQQIYWYKIQQQRQATYARLMHAHAVARKLAIYAIAGGNPSTDPDYKDEYCWLVGEFGEGFFNDELMHLRLTKEEEEKEQT